MRPSAFRCSTTMNHDKMQLQHGRDATMATTRESSQRYSALLSGGHQAHDAAESALPFHVDYEQGDFSLSILISSAHHATSFALASIDRHDAGRKRHSHDWLHSLFCTALFNSMHCSFHHFRKPPWSIRLQQSILIGITRQQQMHCPMLIKRCMYSYC